MGRATMSNFVAIEIVIIGDDDYNCVYLMRGFFNQNEMLLW